MTKTRSDGQAATLAVGEDDGLLHPSIPKTVREATYLTVTNAERYRVITHFFHESYKLQRHRLKTRQVWRYVQEQYDSTYTIEQCALDLNALVSFGNLVPEQDRDNVSSLEEWRGRDNVYDLTPITIRLEEALEAFRKDHTSRASLDPTLIEVIRAAVHGLTRTLGETTEAEEQDAEYVARRIRRPWLEIYRQFSDLTAGANAFHHALRSAKPADMAEAGALRIYKKVLLENLQTFIVELIDAGESLRDRTHEWEESAITLRLLNLLTAFDVEHVSDPTQVQLNADEVRERYRQQLSAFVGWFQPDGGVDALRHTTRNAIEMAARITARLTDRHRVGSSRRADLERLASAFTRCRTLEDAHVLAALTLGVPTARHIVGSEQWGVMSHTRSVWEQPAHEVPLRAIVRGSKPRARPTAVVDRTELQQALLLQEEEHRRAEADAWSALFANGPLEITDLELADTATRDRVLDALDACLASPEGVGYASDGSMLRVEAPPAGTPFGRLRAPDGDFLTPRFRLIREESGRGAA